MNSKKTKKALRRAENYFYSGEYKEAMRTYAILLRDFPALEEARIGAILTDIAIENDEEAQALFEYYQVLKNDNDENAETIIEGMIGSIDNTFEKISDILDGVLSSKESEESIEGITYKDFKKLVDRRGNFKMAFEDIMFSTKVVITEKEDLLDFLQLLVENGFNEMAMRYIEGVAMAYPGESRIQDILEKIKG